MPLRIKKVKDGIQFAAIIQPRSAKNEITGYHNNTLKIRLTAPPVDGVANRSCIKLLSKTLKVNASQVSIVSGFSSRHKIIEVNSLTESTLLNILHLAVNHSP